MEFLIILMAQQGKGGGPQFIFLLLIIFVFYFFMIRPQIKRQKELKKFRDSLSKGDKVITTGGIYGKIVEVKENVVILDAGNQIRLKVDKNAIIKDTSDIQQTTK